MSRGTVKPDPAARTTKPRGPIVDQVVSQVKAPAGPICSICRQGPNPLTGVPILRTSGDFGHLLCMVATPGAAVLN